MLARLFCFLFFVNTISRASKHMDVRSLVFDRTGFWVQVHNLPIGSFFMVVTQEVVSVVGTINESETDVSEGEGCKFLRIRIPVNLMEPVV